MKDLIYLLLSALPMFLCFFWTVFFLCRYGSAAKDRKILFWFMLTATLLYFGHFIFFNRIYALIPFTDSVYNFTTLAVYPIYYLYILTLTEGTFRKYWLLLVPALLLSLTIGLLYLGMPKASLTAFIDSYEYGTGELPAEPLGRVSARVHDAVKILFAVQIFPILYFGLKKLSGFRRQVNECFSGSENRKMQNISILLICFVATSILSSLANLIGRAFFTDSAPLVAIPSLLFSALLFAVGYVGSIQTFNFEDLRKETQTKTGTETGRNEEKGHDTDEAMRTLRNEIDRLMKEERLYLDPQLKLSDIAGRLNTNRTYVYNALSRREDSEQRSFSDYVNRYRVRHAQELLKDRKSASTGIENVIYESGFQSKSTFYTHFRHVVGMTPKEWMGRLEK